MKSPVTKMLTAGSVASSSVDLLDGLLPAADSRDDCSDHDRECGRGDSNPHVLSNTGT